MIVPRAVRTTYAAASDVQKAVGQDDRHRPHRHIRRHRQQREITVRVDHADRGLTRRKLAGRVEPPVRVHGEHTAIFKRNQPRCTAARGRPHDPLRHPVELNAEVHGIWHGADAGDKSTAGRLMMRMAASGIRRSSWVAGEIVTQSASSTPEDVQRGIARQPGRINARGRRRLIGDRHSVQDESSSSQWRLCRIGIRAG
ncbi:MAG: hypothetical protein HND48_16245 [Chloroflexi bacterium]|nr:hypothetical protein [Chloroflexota bacterium]